MFAPARELGYPLRHVHRHCGAVGDESRNRSSSQYSWKGRVVESLERTDQLLRGGGPDAPARVIDLVLYRSAILLFCVAPGTFAEKLFVRARRHLCGRPFHVQCCPAEVATCSKLVL